MTKTQFKKKFKTALVEERAKSGMTQVELEKKICTGDSGNGWLSQLEHGRKTPTSFNYIQFCEVLPGLHEKVMKVG